MLKNNKTPSVLYYSKGYVVIYSFGKIDKILAKTMKGCTRNKKNVQINTGNRSISIKLKNETTSRAICIVLSALIDENIKYVNYYY